MAEACHPGDPQPPETKEEGERTHLRTFHQPGINHNATLPLIEIVLFFQCSTASPSIANCRHASSHDDQWARCATFEANQRSYWPRSYSTEDCAAPHTCAEQGRWQRQEQGAFARHSTGQAGGPTHSGRRLPLLLPFLPSGASALSAAPPCQAVGADLGSSRAQNLRPAPPLQPTSQESDSST